MTASVEVEAVVMLMVAAEDGGRDMPTFDFFSSFGCSDGRFTQVLKMHSKVPLGVLCFDTATDVSRVLEAEAIFILSGVDLVPESALAEIAEAVMGVAEMAWVAVAEALVAAIVEVTGVSIRATKGAAAASLLFW
eukprot:15355408-Ditylum_brightwellii.AAC.1